MKLCSACLLGINCRFRGDNKLNEKVVELAKKGELIPVCPEQMGGLATPRDQTEVINGRMVTVEGEDQTEMYLKGAKEVLRLAKLLNIKEAIFKQKSPSCGCGKIYDGTFSGNLIDGDGIATKLLKENGIKVISEDEL